MKRKQRGDPELTADAYMNSPSSEQSNHTVTSELEDVSIKFCDCDKKGCMCGAIVGVGFAKCGYCFENHITSRRKGNE